MLADRRAAGASAPNRPRTPNAASLRILTFTNLYPNAEAPQKGVFVENRLRRLHDCGRVSARVVAPVPWFPLRSRSFGAYGGLARVPASDTRHGIVIDYPRYLAIPKVGMSVAPLLMYFAMRRHVRRMVDGGFEFDLIDAHYFYPDGVVAAMLGRHFRKPVVITARGSDINVIAGHSAPRQQILWAAGIASSVICVSEALRQSMIRLGVDAGKIATVRNGVDLATFRPTDRAAVRRRLGIEGSVLLAVGNILEAKGQAMVVEALAAMPGCTLMVVGSGPDESRVRALARERGVESRVRLVGVVPHGALVDYYNAADVMVLATAREGWPNVVLESLACGTPVVATNVGGIPEIITSPAAGRLLEERTPAAIATTVGALLRETPDRAAARAHAEKYSWDEVTAQQIELFSKAVLRPARAPATAFR
jgi:glycosyltransferase involved in cell wall biosynthesis